MSPVTKRWKMTAIVALLLVWQTRSYGQQTAPVAKELKAVTQDMVKKYQSMADRLGTLPSKTDASKWDSVLTGAKEIGEKVAQLKRVRAELLALTKEQGNLTGTFRAKVDQLKGLFLELEKEARREIDGTNGASALPETLLEPIKREAELYRATAEACDKLAGRAALTFAGQKESLVMVDRCGSMLDRLQKASDQYVQLAQLGKQIDESSRGLTIFAAQLNAILDLFGSLNAKTKEAVSFLGEHPIEAPGTTTTLDVPRPAFGVARDAVSSLSAQPKTGDSRRTLATALPSVEGLLSRMDRLERRQGEVAWNRQ
jgi:hypothetical protein